MYIQSKGRNKNGTKNSTTEREIPLVLNFECTPTFSKRTAIQKAESNKHMQGKKVQKRRPKG